MALSREPVSDAETGLRDRAGERPCRCGGRKTLSLIDGKKNAIGPEVSGKPTNQPRTAGPHRCPARLATWMSSGLATILKTSEFIGPPPRRRCLEDVDRRSGWCHGSKVRDIASPVIPTKVGIYSRCGYRPSPV